MGSALSTPNHSQEQLQDPWWPIENQQFSLTIPSRVDTGPGNIPSSNINCSEKNSEVQVGSASSSSDVRLCCNDSSDHNPKQLISDEQSLEEFKEDLQRKRLARQGAMAHIRCELSSLREQLAAEREINRELRAGFNVPVDTREASTSTDPNESQNTHAADNSEIGSSTCSLRSQLAETQLALQLANADNLSLTTELAVVRKQVNSLKEVITCSKEMINIREEQVTQLKAKLHEIESSLAERELKIMSDDLRQEYNRQLANMRNLRQLYEERARVSAAERENLLRQVSIKKDEMATEIEKVKNLEERVASMEAELKTTHKSLSTSKIQCEDYNSENKLLREEMAAINKLFSQMLTGFNGVNNLDIDSLTTMLEENRTLLNEMATSETDPEGACLPKLLFDIVKEANNKEETAEMSTESSDDADAAQSNICLSTSQEIIGNLPKVWRVLMELLNHQKIVQVDFKENGDGEDCYKSVQTPTGPKAELSVSKTYIKLKDLILEKKSLQRDTNKLKTLNGHLERRLHEQEKRLSTVSLELTKTWHLVGKMQRQHRQLHTHEQILRYQLQQKRRLLNELKDELEYCRRKWAAARAKNDESQIQCEDLRKEFARRKKQDANNSAESGYSDGPLSDEDDVEVPKKDYSDVFAVSRKLERTRSQSPKRSSIQGYIRRGNSAPHIAAFLTELVHTTNDIGGEMALQNIASTSVVFEDVLATATVTAPPKEVAISTVVCIPSTSKSDTVVKKPNAPSAEPDASGAVPKRGVRLSRSKREDKKGKNNAESESLEEMFYRLSGAQGEIALSTMEDAEEKRIDRATRIQKLEDQCKSLINQVIETSSCRDQLNEHLNRFQEELKPLGVESEQLEQSVRRSERLKKLEDESKELMKNIRKTTDSGNIMISGEDHLQSSVGTEGCSFDESDSLRSIPKSSSESQQNNEKENVQESSPCADIDPTVKLTATEEAYLARRSERIRRMEEESKHLQNAMAKTTQRSKDLSTKLDNLNERYGHHSNDAVASKSSNDRSPSEALLPTVSTDEVSDQTDCSKAPQTSSEAPNESTIVTPILVQEIEDVTTSLQEDQNINPDESNNEETTG